ncbi:myosin heavy chain, skeletal muscle-like isoform X1 [Nymphalis io]|uniref:myosin heavy chain, skeletal muscle-like isoform X1 n=1 Tax=Inachis io TaxID=171585 RepID=UPI002169650A|nr:myosin heavy chain, skeletal muscle-like isoform X1 [Nymphalis io]
MFNFFKRKGGKAEPSPETSRRQPSDSKPSSVEARAPRNDNDVTNEKSVQRKDVVNLLIPETDYNQKTGVSAILQIMAGKRKRNKRKRDYKIENDTKRCSDATPTPAENNRDAPQPSDDPADFVKALVLQKYAKPEPKQQHVSLVYVSNEPDLEDKRHAEALLREIAKSIDCTIDKLNEKQMGTTDSRLVKEAPVYETVEKKSIDTYKNNLKGELEKLIQDENKDDDAKNDKESSESPATRKSNLKPPRSDNEGCSDDDRSDNGKKRVTFRKHIIFDDGEQQTDEEVDSSFESLTSEEADYLEDLPDNDELLGGYVVSKNDNKTVINVNQNEPIIKVECVDDLRRITSDNSDSGFIEGDKNESSDETSDVKSIAESEDSESEEEIEEIAEEIEEESEVDIVDAEVDNAAETKDLVTQESRFQSQVAALTELADSRCDEAERARELIVSYRKDIEAKDQEIEQLKCDLAAAYKESELVRQRSRSLEEELSAARRCSADLADQLQRRIEEAKKQLRSELEDALTHRAQLETKVQALERDKERLEQEKLLQEQKAKEALEAAEENTAKWRLAHESARSQAAARAERMLADCEWKMRELEKRARDAEKEKKELSESLEQLKSAPPTPSHIAELQQLRGLASEQQRSVQSLALQLQKIETREETLKLEVHRLKDLLEKEGQIRRDKEEQHLQAMNRLEQQHSDKISALKAEHAEAVANAASARAALERAHAERTRTALAQLRAEAERDAKNADRKLRELTARFENLKEVLSSKESQFESAIAEANSKADWDILQLRHLLDKADINYANNIEAMNERFEREKELLIKEWSEKLQQVEQQSSIAVDDARKLLETTRLTLIAEKNDQINKLKEKHRQEMDDQWELFMTDKENCLQRMKLECRQEGEEDRAKRERDLMEEIEDLKAQIHSKVADFDDLTSKAAACGRTLAVTEQELREALEREKELREKRIEDASNLKQCQKASQEQIEHLTRKCACLRKLFDDMRARLAARERAAEQEARSREKELHHLRAEVARLTKLLVEQSCPKLGARTRADGCENSIQNEESFLSKNGPLACETQPNAPRRKGGTLRTPELARKRPTLPELQPLPPEARRNYADIQNGRRRAKSVDLPAVQVPVRIKQLEEKTKE